VKWPHPETIFQFGPTAETKIQPRIERMVRVIRGHSLSALVPAQGRAAFIRG
jgi:hypothetical protein